MQPDSWPRTLGVWNHSQQRHRPAGPLALHKHPQSECDMFMDFTLHSFYSFDIWIFSHDCNKHPLLMTQLVSDQTILHAVIMSALHEREYLETVQC